jgi:predicted ATPase
MIKRIAISGAPGTGKTSLIEELAKHNFTCHPEVSREIIAAQFKIDGDITPWRDLNAFSNLVISKRADQFKSAKNDLEFFDRSIIDSLAYLLKDNLPISKEWDALAKKHKYHKRVFITPPWEEIYQRDAERMEDFKTATNIHKYMVKAYELYGYEIIILPKVKLSKRVKYLLDHIE